MNIRTLLTLSIIIIIIIIIIIYYYCYCYCACFTVYMYVYDNAGNSSPINRWQQNTLDFKDHCLSQRKIGR